MGLRTCRIDGTSIFANVGGFTGLICQIGLFLTHQARNTFTGLEWWLPFVH